MSEVFVFDETMYMDQRRIESAALGASSGAPFTSKDVGKAVKRGTVQNFVPVAGGNEIEGFVTSVEVMTVNDGFSFGGVQRGGTIQAAIGANQGATPAAVNDYVVADTPVALGTAGLAQVKTGTPAKFLWRIIRIISGTGAAGSVVLLERE